MGKQKMVIIITVLFVTVSGIFYSVNYEKKEEAVFIAEENINQASDEILPEENGLSDESVIEENVVSKDKDLEEDVFGKEILSEEPVLIYVHVCGQVRIPGVYCLEEESRITDLIQMAGGFTDNAAKDYVNQAQKLSDGQRVYIPTLEEVADSSLLEEVSITKQQTAVNTKVNINTADEAALMTLTGIGEAKAAAIIEYRETQGGFASIEELKQIEGIKDGVFNKIKDKIEV